ncbi:hypothetical protein AcV5_010342 [Taiwanofungus camphoratus]|nr:hypothetical protein AcV5_010342 [Antrodia cinnamomea]
MIPHGFLLAVLCCLGHARAVTVYGLQGVLAPSIATSDPTTGTSVYDPPTYTGPAAFNPVILAAPPVPSPAIPNQFILSLANNAQDVVGLSIPQSGSFLGFSIEMSVIDQVIGVNASFLQVPFLNLMALVAERAGQVDIRVGGNTQDYAVEVKNLPDNQAIMKYQVDSSNPTQTPTLLFTPEIIHMLANVSALVNAKWYLGIPFNDTTNPRLEIAQTGQSILGENLLGLQLGNEPDLYAAHGHRPSTYSPWDYFDEFSVVVDAISNDSQIPVRNNLIAPSVSGTWTPEDIWNTGFIPTFMNELGALAVEHYPADNCAAQYPNQGFGTPIDPQTVFANYLNHTSGQSIVAPYLNSTAIAQASGKPFLMLETNTASCGGFPGVSDSFGAALWSIDYALQMAYANFSGANLHVGGRDDSYNPFTPPPSNMTNFEQWTIGPIFYSVLAVAEALGSSNTSRILDLNANGANIYTPAYAIYEQGTIARVALFNYITDPSGASTYTATISVSDTNEQNVTPPQVRVKYLLAESVSVKDNITWAGQTLGNRYAADGRLQGSEDVQTITCDQGANTCLVQVPAPGFALVFMSDEAFQDSVPTSTATFATTAATNPIETATVNPSVLATSNGQNGLGRKEGKLGSTSERSNGTVRAAGVFSAAATLMAFFAGVGLLWRAL